MLTLSVVSRVEAQGEKVALFGHPRVIKVPNMVKVEALHQLMAGEYLEENWRLCLVDETGEDCARCGKGLRCRGCEVSQLADDGGDLLLKPGDGLALNYHSVEKNRLEQVNRARADASMFLDRAKTNLNLYDCLEAFSNPEQLDEDNPWFCPMCRRDQPATKTLSVSRYPNFLIIYLKRVIYIKKDDMGCMKVDNRVEFPLEGLDMTPYLAGPLQQGGEQFQLYATVNHSGGPGGGHYTSYAAHPVHNTKVTKEAPVSEKQNLAYVLFYKRTGCEYAMEMPDLNHANNKNEDKVNQSHVAMEETI